MLVSAIKPLVGIVILVSLAAGTALAGGESDQDAAGSLARACAGLPTSRGLENALFDMRALSNGGYDPVCGSLAENALPVRR
jgi:hypothetical protein